MKKKIKLTIVFLVSLLPMLLNQYGGKKCTRTSSTKSRNIY